MTKVILREANSKNTHIYIYNNKKERRKKKGNIYKRAQKRRLITRNKASQNKRKEIERAEKPRRLGCRKGRRVCVSEIHKLSAYPGNLEASQIGRIIFSGIVERSWSVYAIAALSTER